MTDDDYRWACETCDLIVAQNDDLYPPRDARQTEAFGVWRQLFEFIMRRREPSPSLAYQQLGELWRSYIALAYPQHLPMHEKYLKK